MTPAATRLYMDCIWSWAAELELGMAEVRPEAVPEAGSPEATLEKKEEDCEVAGGDSCDCGVPEEEVVKGYRPPEPGNSYHEEQSYLGIILFILSLWPQSMVTIQIRILAN